MPKDDIKKTTENKSVTVPAFPFVKSELKSTPVRSLTFDNKKQRNAKMIEKGLAKPGSISYDTLRRAANSVHVVRICINVLKEKITKTKWIVKSIDPLVDVDEAKIKEVEELFKHPNGNDETFRTLLDKMLEDLLVLDAVSIEKTRFPNGKLAQLHFVDSGTIRPVFDEHGNQDVSIPVNSKEEGRVDLPVSYVQVLDNSQYGGPESGEIIAAWPKKDFIYFHQHPQGSFEGFGYGLSPIESVIGVVSNLLNADNFNSTYFEEGAFPPLILQLMGQMNQGDLEAAREYLYSELLGSPHRPAIMAGDKKAEIINLKDITNRDMQFMEYTEFLARLLAAAYGLSGQDIGLVDDLNKATSQTQVGLSEEKGYGSILHLLKEIFNTQIIWKDFGYTDLEFEWVVDDRTDPATISTINDAALKNGTITINEARTKMGLIPYNADWADEPMLLDGDGKYSKLAPVEEAAEEDSAMVGNENPYKEQTVEKSIMTPDGYKTWMDDRGYSQPFIFSEIMTGLGYVIKPPVAVNLMSQKVEVEIAEELYGMGLNVPLIMKMTYDDIFKSILPTDQVRNEFLKYVSMTTEYDSEKWKARSGGSRKFGYYLVSPFIDGYPLDSKLVRNDMLRDPLSYEQAIKDLAALWLAEKNLVLGDRRADQYIVTHDKRIFGVDYQFKGDKERWKDTSQDVQKVLMEIPHLYELFHEEIGRKPKYQIIKKIKNFIKAALLQPSPHAVDLDQDFQNYPVMFGQLYNDDFSRDEVKQIFKLQDIRIMKRYRLTEVAFAYDFNSMRDSLKKWVDDNPLSYGGIITTGDNAGVKYTLYVRK
jgi:hypothetical protein